MHLIRAVAKTARLSPNGTQLRNAPKILVTKQSRKKLFNYLEYMKDFIFIMSPVSVPGKTSLAQQILSAKKQNAIEEQTRKKRAGM